MHKKVIALLLVFVFVMGFIVTAEEEAAPQMPQRQIQKEGQVRERPIPRSHLPRYREGQRQRGGQDQAAREVALLYALNKLELTTAQKSQLLPVLKAFARKKAMVQQKVQNLFIAERDVLLRGEAGKGQQALRKEIATELKQIEAAQKELQSQLSKILRAEQVRKMSFLINPMRQGGWLAKARRGEAEFRGGSAGPDRLSLLIQVLEKQIPAGKDRQVKR